jgi:hypothetical protein
MNKTLQTLVATQFEEAGFETLAGEIRNSNGIQGVRKVAIKVIKKLCVLDPSGFGQEINNIGNKGDSNNG